MWSFFSIKKKIVARATTAKHQEGKKCVHIHKWKYYAAKSVELIFPQIKFLRCHDYTPPLIHPLSFVLSLARSLGSRVAQQWKKISNPYSYIIHLHKWYFIFFFSPLVFISIAVFFFSFSFCYFLIFKCTSFHCTAFELPPTNDDGGKKRKKNNKWNHNVRE